ncbi:CAP domain-containing protein [Clostridium chromiireducens]|uniref:Autolysin n=1 Tax=Clostridium chromiireducens TaxID=225345 RepID=A0A1V4IET8_9CLOT|nr:CAP domain-containing protein [Clostridium chromiireducens]OPJ58364.1 autolysin [Clostridium chromiireducens]RII36379.1 serine protease [Clostridium chromiireducens]
MKKAFLTKTMSAIIVATITTILPLGVSAEWKQNIDKTWSYTERNTIAKGWRYISGEWYYFNSDGNMKTGWTYDRGQWYYLDSSGAMEEGWVNIKGTWYYFDSTGAMKTGWIKENGYWYYLDYQDGMKTGTVELGSRTYYFDNSGRLRNYATVSEVTTSTTSGSNQQTTQTSNSTSSGATISVSGLPNLPKNYSVSVQAAAENKILELMNQKRTEAGLKALVMDNTLLQVARYKSNHMIQYNYFDHTTPQGNNWTSWLQAIGYKYTATGENIAYNTYDAVYLFTQWWNSTGHRANMMNPSYNRVGIGVLNGNGKYMGTQTFSN